jgi:hypothetical protein
MNANVNPSTTGSESGVNPEPLVQVFQLMNGSGTVDWKGTGYVYISETWVPENRVDMPSVYFWSPSSSSSFSPFSRPAFPTSSSSSSIREICRHRLWVVHGDTVFVRHDISTSIEYYHLRGNIIMWHDPIAQVYLALVFEDKDASQSFSSSVKWCQTVMQMQPQMLHQQQEGEQ